MLRTLAQLLFGKRLPRRKSPQPRRKVPSLEALENRELLTAGFVASGQDGAGNVYNLAGNGNLYENANPAPIASSVQAFTQGIDAQGNRYAVYIALPGGLTVAFSPSGPTAMSPNVAQQTTRNDGATYVLMQQGELYMEAFNEVFLLDSGVKGFGMRGDGNAYIEGANDNLYLNTPQNNYPLGTVVAFGQDGAGNGYYLEGNGNLYENTPSSPANPAPITTGVQDFTQGIDAQGKRYAVYVALPGGLTVAYTASGPTAISTNVAQQATRSDGATYLLMQQGELYLEAFNEVFLLDSGVKGFGMRGDGNAYIEGANDNLYLNTPQNNYPLGTVVAFGQDGAGNGYYLEGNGNLYENTPSSPANPAPITTSVQDFTQGIDAQGNRYAVYVALPGGLTVAYTASGPTAISTNVAQQATRSDGATYLLMQQGELYLEAFNEVFLLDGSVEAFGMRSDGNAYIESANDDLYLNTPQTDHDFGVIQQFAMSSDGTGYYLQGGTLTHNTLLQNVTLLSSGVVSFVIGPANNFYYLDSYGKVFDYSKGNQLVASLPNQVPANYQGWTYKIDLVLHFNPLYTYAIDREFVVPAPGGSEQAQADNALQEGRAVIDQYKQELLSLGFPLDKANPFLVIDSVQDRSPPPSPPPPRPPASTQWYNYTISISYDYTDENGDDQTGNSGLLYCQATNDQAAEDYLVNTVYGPRLTAEGVDWYGLMIPTILQRQPIPVPASSADESQRFALSTATSITASSASSVTVTALDASGNVDPGYTGTLFFTSSDQGAGLPVSYTFTTADQGSHTFAVSLETAAIQTINAIDSTGMMSGQATVQVTPATASNFTLSAPTSTSAGAPEAVTVTALDTDGNVVNGYTGTVFFTSSDQSAGLPPSYTFTAADQGSHTFSVPLETAGNQTITATDSTGTISEQATVQVNPPAEYAVAQFGTAGVWRYSTVTGWKQLTAGNASMVAIDDRGDVVGEFAGAGVWRYEDAGGWKQLTGTNASQVSIAGNGTVAVELQGYGVWRYEDAGGWKQLSGGNASSLAVDASGDVVGEFQGAGVWRYEDTGGWKQLTAGNASQVSIAGNGIVAAEFQGAGVWRYEDAGGWKQLTASNASSLAVDASGDVVAELVGAGVWRFKVGSAGVQLTGGNASQVAIDVLGNVVAEFPGSGLWRYGSNGWQRLTPTDASSIGA